MQRDDKAIFEEQYRVIAVAADRLQVRGVLTGEVLTILNPQPDCPLRFEDFPPGKLIILTDPSTEVAS